MEEFDQEAERIWNDAKSSYDQTPKVQALIFVEGYEDEYEKFDGIVEREAKQEGDYDF